MTEEEYRDIYDRVTRIARDVIARTEAKTKSGSVSVESMGDYTDMIKDVTKAMYNVKRLKHIGHHADMDTM